MSTTLTQARTAILEFADDQLGRRYAPTTNGTQDFSKVDRALSGAISDCLIEYTRAGGDKFDQEFNFTTSATDGSASLSAQKVLTIRQVAIVVDPTIYKIPPKSKMRRGYTDAVARNLRMLYVQEYAVQTTAANPFMVDASGNAAPTWPTFEDWIFAEAASRLLVKDAETRQQLEIVRERLKHASIMRSDVPASFPWPRPEWSPIIDQLNWSWVPATQTLYTIRISW